MNEFFAPLHYAFMRDALVVGIVIAAMCAMLSCYLVLKGWSLMGDAVSHAVLPGIVLAYIAGIPLAIGAFAAGLFCAAGTGFIKHHSRIKEDTVMGVVFTGMFAFGLVLFSRTPSDMHLDHVLLGNILGITRTQLWQTMVLGTPVIAVTLAFRRDLLLICFDPAHSRVIGLPLGLLNHLLLALLAIAIVVSIQAVGIILVVAMLVTPGCTAHLWTDRFDRMLSIAVTIAVSSTVAGVFISHHIDGSTAACIVLTQALLFAISLFFAPKHGILFRNRNAPAGG